MSDVLSKPKVKIGDKIKKQIKAQEDYEKQVIVHCKIKTSDNMSMGIRIWPTTFLLDNDSNHQSTLLHYENIPMVPEWKEIAPGVDYVFTLIFSGLPKSCSKFHLIEVIPQSGGFEVLNIGRNKTDVYSVEL